MQRIVELHTRLKTTLDTKSQQGRRFAIGVFLRQVIIRRFGQTGEIDPTDLCMAFKVIGHRQCVFAVPLHTQWQCLHTLQDQESIHRAQRRTRITQWHGARTCDVGRRTHGLGVDNPVIGRLGLVQHMEFFRVFFPREIAAIDNHATQ